MKVMVFVDGLLSNDLSEVYIKWNEMYILSRLEIFKESDLKKFQEYEAINGYTTETYESLHKSYVKTPYRLSNKKDIEEQIMKTLPYFSKKKNPDLTKNIIKGFAKFLKCLDSFFDMLDIISAENCRIKIFGSVTLKNINILRATNKFQNRPWFSNITIAIDDAELFEYQSDNGTCYAQVYANYNITRVRNHPNI
ncbi:hypothetical protein Glove_379g18 [Diversispora epigaea]|uniref:Uncharacterized protein n=1 Tax=Diversispora epigaea TaxID=1348612 RepID=A0A397H8L3_9GLOM|nr:hypothetical protein Glove_379g18 [Diversispora epigaea]